MNKIFTKNIHVIKPETLFGVFFLLVLCAGYCFSSEETTLKEQKVSAHYPLRYGAYQGIKLEPMERQEDPCQIGTIYVKKKEEGETDNLLFYCRENKITYKGEWMPIISDIWSNYGNDIFLKSFADPDMHLAIGMEDTQLWASGGIVPTKLFLKDAGLLAFGTYGEGQTINVSGAGRRLFWYPRKSAFRAGYVDNNQWDDDNIGEFSAAFGYNTMAMGDYSTAFGAQTYALGRATFAAGKLTYAVGDYSVVFGKKGKAYGRASLVMGLNSEAGVNPIYIIPSISKRACSSDPLIITRECPNYQTAGGYESKAWGEGSVAFGYKAEAGINPYTDPPTCGKAPLSACTNYQTAMGYEVKATGEAAVAMGYQTLASGDYSFASGHLTRATGKASIASGQYARATGDYSFAVGGGSDPDLGYTEASGEGSIALGYETKAGAFTSMALGYKTMSFGEGSLAAGDESEAYGDGAVALGIRTKAGLRPFAKGAEPQECQTASPPYCTHYATALGTETLATGTAATAIGYQTVATGDYAMALGYQTKAQSQNVFVVGSRNIDNGDPINWVDTDPLFIVGNGYPGDVVNPPTESNAMIVFKNGKVAIGSSNPDISQNIFLEVGGSMNVTGTCTAGTSDARLKTDIKSVTHSLERLKQIHGIEFYWQDKQRSAKHQMGLVAQEVEKVFPEVVYTDPQGYKLISYSRFVSVLIEALKELNIHKDEQQKELQKQNEILIKQQEQLRRQMEELKKLNEMNVKGRLSQL